jgi:16S rRNA (cytidine1402-2'-O)-methyltransferase
MTKGTLFLIPNVLDKGQPSRVITPSVLEVVNQLRYFIVEEERAARAFLARAGMRDHLNDLDWAILNEHTEAAEIPHIINPLLQGVDAGMLSEAGCPAVADPGSNLVITAHAMGIRVVPFTGPSSIILALMASGLNGQQFTFNGYLPIKTKERIQRIRELEQRLKRSGETQLFIETPYRNRQLFKDLVDYLSPQTRLCLAVDLTTPQEYIQTRTIAEWKKGVPDLHKRPAVFLIGR